MACCDNHDRMDKKLQTDEYNDAPCGTPTNPHGERRFCCAQCPTQGQPIIPREEWHDNPLLWMQLPEAAHLEVMRMHTDKRVREWRVNRKIRVEGGRQT
jgi:hypothetical protein